MLPLLRHFSFVCDQFGLVLEHNITSYSFPALRALTFVAFCSILIVIIITTSVLLLTSIIIDMMYSVNYVSCDRSG